MKITNTRPEQPFIYHLTMMICASIIIGLMFIFIIRPLGNYLYVILTK